MTDSWSTRHLLRQYALLFLAVALAWFGWWMTEQVRSGGDLGERAIVGVGGGLSIALGFGVYTWFSAKGVREFRRLSDAERRQVDQALRSGRPHRDPSLRAAERARAEALLPTASGPVVVLLLLVVAGVYLSTSVGSPPLWYLLVWVLAVLLAAAGFVGMRRLVPDGVREVLRLTAED